MNKKTLTIAITTYKRNNILIYNLSQIIKQIEKCHLQDKVSILIGGNNCNQILQNEIKSKFKSHDITVLINFINFTFK